MMSIDHNKMAFEVKSEDLNFGQNVFELTELPIQKLSDKIDNEVKFREWIQRDSFESEYGFSDKYNRSICQSLLHRLGEI